MATIAAEPTQTLPPLTVVSRVTSIPLVSSSLETIDQKLSSNTYTSFFYPAAKELSSTAYKYTEPIQTRFAPLIVRADGFANKAVDVVEARYPYPFTAKPEEVTEYVRERRESIHHSIDETVKNPAIHVATEIDHRFAPILDFVEAALKRITNSSEPGPSAPDAKYQYQRVLALTRNLYGYSNEQLKQLQAQSALLQRATETAHSISSHANSSLTNAHSRVQQLSNTMLAELQKLQAHTTAFAASIQSTATNTVQSHIPPFIQQAFAEISPMLSAAISDFSSTLAAKDAPFPERINKVAADVRERIVPLLGNIAKAVGDALGPKSDIAAPEINGKTDLVKDVPPEHSEARPSNENGVPTEPDHVEHSKKGRRESSTKSPEADAKRSESSTRHTEPRKASPSKDRHHKSSHGKEKHSEASEKSGSRHGAKEHASHTK